VAQQQEITKQAGILADAQKFLASIGGGSKTTSTGAIDPMPIVIGSVAVIGTGIAVYMLTRKRRR
jgi:3-polyprenyl-4-hydroxybenzoate decarboxylase